MKAFGQFIFCMGVMASVLVPLAALSKDEAKAAEKDDKKYELQGSKLVEKVKNKDKSKGTNTVYKTGRTFPLMFSRNTVKKPVKK